MSNLPPTELPMSQPTDLATRAVKLLGILSTLGAIVVMTLLAVRPINSPDIGYHLAYGEHFLDTGKIVQTNQWVYPPLDANILKDPDNCGPGSWFDASTGTYHFVNANWLSQVVMAVAYRKSGMNGLVALQAVLLGMIAVLLVVPMLRNRAPWHWMGPAILLAALALDIRIPLRPELFGFLMLAGQWAMLAGPGFGWKRAAGVTVLQVAAANVHSYFLLAIALTGAMFLEAALEWWLSKPTAAADAPDAPDAPTPPHPMPPRMKWLGAALAGVILACLVNPWFVRGAMMPVQTVFYLGSNHITGDTPQGQVPHPWAMIKEFHPPFRDWAREGFRDRAVPVAILALAVAGAVIGGLRRRWGWALAMLVMGYVGWQMHRNIAAAAVIVLPMAAVMLSREWASLRGRLPEFSPPLVRLGGGVVAALGLAAAIYMVVSVTTNRFYLGSDRATRFGLGCSRLALPFDAADWIDKHKLSGHIYTPYTSSSNLMFFTNPHQDMPTLSNTWAYPPYLMLRSALWELDPDLDQAPKEFILLVKDAYANRFDAGVRDWDIQTVVLQYPVGGVYPSGLLKKMAKSPDWVMVDIGPTHIILLRRNEQNRSLIDENRITASTFDLEKFVARCAASDPYPWFGLTYGGKILLEWSMSMKSPKAEDTPAVVAWLDHAAAVYKRSLDINPNYHGAMNGLAETYMQKGVIQINIAQKYMLDGHTDEAEKARREAENQWSQASQLLKKVLSLKPKDNRATALQQEIARLSAILDRITGHASQSVPELP